MALSVDRDVEFFASQELVDVPVDDSVVIYKGALVGLNASTGKARALEAGDLFIGMAYRRADNAGGGIKVRLHQQIDVVHALAGVAQADVGSIVYASDDETLTLTPTDNSTVGVLVGVESAGVARVRCQPWS